MADNTVAQQADPSPATGAAAAAAAEKGNSHVPSEQAIAQEADATPAPQNLSQGPRTTKVGAPEWPSLADDHPLSKFRAKLPSLIEEASYSEVYGLDLQSATPFHQNLILQKFLRANADDVDKAATQLLQTLKWRKEFQPLQTLDETFSSARFGGLGYVIRLQDVPDSPTSGAGGSDGVSSDGGADGVPATFNIYGAVKDPEATFGDIDGFLRWRVALMELSIRELHLSSAAVPIPDFGQGADPYQGLQVHDYLQVSFLRQNKFTKAASKKAIEVFSSYYPETLSRKFFVNVPVFMGWMFSAMSVFLSKETTKKFTVLSYGEYLKDALGNNVPEAYGGKGEKLETRGVTPKVE